MRRLTRLALLLSLAAAIGLPQVASAASHDHAEKVGPAATPRDLVARLWEPLARLFGGPGETGGPTSDPDGAAATADTRPGAAPPPADRTQGAPTGGNESDGGPTSDPNG